MAGIEIDVDVSEIIERYGVTLGIEHEWLNTEGVTPPIGPADAPPLTLSVRLTILDAPKAKVACQRCDGSGWITRNRFLDASSDDYEAVTTGCPRCGGTGEED